MRLLFDENLSPQLPRLVADLLPESTHVLECGLEGQSDTAIWDYARENHLTIVSKDSDFHARSILANSPPKVIWLNVGNCTTRSLSLLLRRHAGSILALEDGLEFVLVLS